jgi:hypothetical protein
MLVPCVADLDRAASLRRHLLLSLGQDNSTKSVIETPPSETWQVKFHPTSDSLLLAAAGGSSSRVALWSAEDAQSKAHLGIPAVSSPLLLLPLAVPQAPWGLASG